MPFIRVHTPQNVTLEYQVASLGDRLVATILDNLVIAAWVLLVIVILSNLAFIPEKIRLWSMVLLAGIPFLFYHLVSEILLDGQSIGKKARHLRVVRLDGTSPRLGDYVLRWLLRLVDSSFSGMVGMVCIAVNEKGQRLGDLAAGTSVINLRAQAAPLPDIASLVAASTYQPVFPQAATLTDHDISLLTQLLNRAITAGNEELLHETATKIKALLNVQTDLSDVVFLQTVLRDHYYYTYEQPAMG